MKSCAAASGNECAPDYEYPNHRDEDLNHIRRKSNLAAFLDGYIIG
jgi:hypothetical protein